MNQLPIHAFAATATVTPTVQRRLALATLACMLAGCNTAPTSDPAFEAIRPPLIDSAPATAGAIYRVGHNLVLFQDLRARRVGDILFIQLNEETQASKSAETDLEKTNSTSISNPTLLGSQVRFNAPGVLPLALNQDNNLETNLSSSSDFTGKGESKQSNSLTGEIAVTVAEVLPNGNLVVQGEKLFTLNRGHEHIRFSGIVRPEDIGTDNSVASTRVAGARIIYAGEGETASASSIGWLARFFISAIFPF